MSLSLLLFYFFGCLGIGSSMMVVLSRNPVFSVLFLILSFFNISALLFLLELEFLPIVFLVVYVGAVAVLFLFVVMMLNVAQQKQSWFIGRKSTHIPSGLIVAVIIFLELLVIVGGWKYKPNVMNSSNLIINQETTNTHLIGNVMYTDFIHLFQISGIILLLAMIGAIVLTYRKREGLKTQSYIKQISREREDSVQLKDVEFDKGVKIND